MKLVTCGLGFVQERRCSISPPPHDTLTAAPAALNRTHGVDTTDQGDQPPSMVMTRLPWPRTGVVKAKKVSVRTTATNEPTEWDMATFSPVKGSSVPTLKS